TLEELRGGFVQLQNGFAFRRPFAILGAGLRHGHAGPLGEPPHGFQERQLLLQFDELHHVALRVAAEALEEAFVRVDVKRRRLLGVKWTESLPRRTRLPEGRDVTDDGDDVRLRLQILDERWREQGHDRRDATPSVPRSWQP